MKVRLLDIAHARSGDKGDTANVGLIARVEAGRAHVDGVGAVGNGGADGHEGAGGGEELGDTAMCHKH